MTEPARDDMSPQWYTGQRLHSVTALLCGLTLVLTVFAEQSDGLGIPIPPHRVALGVTVVSGALLLLHARPRFSGMHSLLTLQAVWALASMAVTGSLFSNYAGYAFLDQLLVPALMVLLGALAFRSAAARSALIKSITLTAAYIGLVSVFQVTDISAPLFPSVPAELAVDAIPRAGGPFLQVGANGAALAMSVPFIIWTVLNGGRIWRPIALLSLALSLAGAFFTLTRSVWIAAGVSLFAYLALQPRARRWILPGALLLAVGVAAVLTFSDAVATAVTDRLGTSRSLDDRAITNAAAVDMAVTYPLTGIGWGRFLDVIDAWVVQPDIGALTNTHIPAHNVFLSRAAELGLPGALLFVGTIVLGPVRAMVMPGRENAEWRNFIIPVFLAWLIVAMLTPMGYAYPNYLLWLITGVALGVHWDSAAGRHRLSAPAGGVVASPQWMVNS